MARQLVGCTHAGGHASLCGNQRRLTVHGDWTGGASHHKHSEYGYHNMCGHYLNFCVCVHVCWCHLASQSAAWPAPAVEHVVATRNGRNERGRAESPHHVPHL